MRRTTGTAGATLRMQHNGRMPVLTTSNAALATGYVLAVPFTLYLPGFLRLWRRREPGVFAAEEFGAVLIATGFALKGQAVSAVVNGGWAAGLAVAYAFEGRKRSRALFG